MEDYQDEQAEAHLVRAADEEERKIKEKKILAIFESDRIREEEERKRKQIVQPEVEEAVRQVLSYSSISFSRHFDFKFVKFDFENLFIFYLANLGSDRKRDSTENFCRKKWRKRFAQLS